MRTNEFLQFATAPGANIANQAAYRDDPARLNGNTTGLLRSTFTNKAWRQASVIAAAWGEVIVQTLDEDALDDGNFGLIVSQIIDCMRYYAGLPVPAVIVSDVPPPWEEYLWFCSADLHLYAPYDDGTSKQWVVANNYEGIVKDAPVDGKGYIRKDAGWVAVIDGGTW